MLDSVSLTSHVTFKISFKTVVDSLSDPKDDCVNSVTKLGGEESTVKPFDVASDHKPGKKSHDARCLSGHRYTTAIRRSDTYNYIHNQV